MFVYEVSVPIPTAPGKSRVTYVVADRAADVRAWVDGTMMSKREDREASKWHASEHSWRRKTKAGRYYIRKVRIEAFGRSQVKEYATHCPSTRKGA